MLSVNGNGHKIVKAMKHQSLQVVGERVIEPGDLRNPCTTCSCTDHTGQWSIVDSDSATACLSSGVIILASRSVSPEGVKMLALTRALPVGHFYDLIVYRECQLRRAKLMFPLYAVVGLSILENFSSQLPRDLFPISEVNYIEKIPFPGISSR